MTSYDIECPYCGGQQNIDHDDGYGYEEDVVHQQQCCDCDMIFTYTTSIIYHYNTQKADCLNGSEHKWKPTLTYPKFATKLRCETCDEEREPTKEEKIKYKIPIKL